MELEIVIANNTRMEVLGNEIMDYVETIELLVDDRMNRVETI
jgi:hypothetical protein